MYPGCRYLGVGYLRGEYPGDRVYIPPASPRVEVTAAFWYGSYYLILSCLHWFFVYCFNLSKFIFQLLTKDKDMRNLFL